jgi:hypothetical protein
LELALHQYRQAREAWAGLAERARGIYAADLSVSDKYSERSHWLAHLPLIDEDIARLEARLASAAPSADARVAEAMAIALGRPRQRSASITHTPPDAFSPGEDLPLTVTIARGRPVSSVTCCYRHVNQAERFQEASMTRDGRRYRVNIPGAYTNSPYPLQYYFVAAGSPMVVDLCPGLGSDLIGEPYFVVRRSA